MLAQYSAGSSTLQLSRSGQLEGRFTDASAAHDLTRATRRYLRSMDFDIAEIFEPVRLSAGRLQRHGGAEPLRRAGV